MGGQARYGKWRGTRVGCQNGPRSCCHDWSMLADVGEPWFPDVDESWDIIVDWLGEYCPSESPLAKGVARFDLAYCRCV